MNRYLIIGLFVLSACASQPRQQGITVIGTVADQERFAGLWRGHLDAVDDREDGDIEFSLREGQGTLLTQLRPGAGRILWIRVAGNTLTGAIQPHWDELCQCDIYTTFDATLEGAELRGTMRRRAKLQWRDVGTWTATRVQ